jgi:hypothetical protein
VLAGEPLPREPLQTDIRWHHDKLLIVFTHHRLMQAGKISHHFQPMSPTVLSLPLCAQ